MGPKVWRIVHYLSFLMFIMVTAHGILSGTDTKVLAMQMVYIGSAAVVIFLTLFRMLTAKEARRPARTPAKAPATAPAKQLPVAAPAPRPAVRPAPAVQAAPESMPARLSPAMRASTAPPASSAVE